MFSFPFPKCLFLKIKLIFVSDVVSRTLLNSLKSSKYFVDGLGFSLYTEMSSASEDSFRFSFPI